MKLAQFDAADLKSIENKVGTKNSGGKITDFISDLLPYLFYFAGIMLFIYLIAGGFQLMFSGGVPEKVQAGKGKITSALIGFLIVFFAYWLVQLLSKVIGIDPINNIF